jgi:hypothetical protein
VLFKLFSIVIFDHIENTVHPAAIFLRVCLLKTYRERKMLKTIIATFIFLLSFTSVADELQIGTIYRLSSTLDVTKVGDETTKYTALKNSKYQVIAKDATGNFIIQFNKVYTSSDTRYANSKWVNWDETFILPFKVEDTFEVSAVSEESLTGLSAGPLIVPFKYRVNDKSITGDATVGMYAGITFEPGCTKSNWCFRITPIISAGISQVSVSDGENSTSKTSATWAAGFLISNWSDLNIGVVYGQDRIGDSSWEHEGKGWVSIMVGWQL